MPLFLESRLSLIQDFNIPNRGINFIPRLESVPESTIKTNQGFWYFAEKKSKISRDFRGKFAEKSADFARNFGGKLRQETISKKQPISLDFFWQISLKSINFASIWPALFNVFLTGIIICSFNNSSLEKWANVKAINIMVSAQFFATFI